MVTMSWGGVGDDEHPIHKVRTSGLRINQYFLRMGVIVSVFYLIVALLGCAPDNLPDWAESVPIEAEFVACGESREVRVACVLDGDTFDVGACGSDKTERVRLLGIDATEISHSGSEAECWSDVATVELARMIEGELVTLTFDEDCTDLYDRTLAYVWLPNDDDVTKTTTTDDPEDDLMVNETLLSDGTVYRYDSDGLRYAVRLDSAAASAEAMGLGVWGSCE